MDYEYSCNSQDCLDNSGIPDVGTDGPSIGGDSWVEDSTIDLDECWSEIDFANSYYDCINNMELCQNNSLVLTKYDEENNFCYQARYDSIENNSTSSNFDDNDFIPFPILNSYLINNFKYNNFLK